MDQGHLVLMCLILRIAGYTIVTPQYEIAHPEIHVLHNKCLVA